MQPTEILIEEHRVIGKVLDCLEAMAHRCTEEGNLDYSSARKALDFFREFADHCHHEKEEKNLFPLMESKGFSPEDGPTGVMRREHEEGRRFVREMNRAIDEAQADDPSAFRRFVEFAHQYVELLRQHIQKEDSCLFPMANQTFSAEEQQQLAERFEAVESDEAHAGKHRKYLAIADELVSITRSYSLVNEDG